MAINDPVFVYGELQFVNATTADNTPDFNYGELTILYETVASGTISGSGAVQAQSATASGTGSVIVKGSSSSQAQSATAAGAGKIIIQGSGAGSAQPATCAGAGGVLVRGNGAAVAQPATASGTGALLIQGAGAGAAQSATANGTGAVLIKGSGTVQAQSATASGTGSASDDRTGYGAAQAQSATCAGTGTVLIKGAGGGAAQSASASGVGTVIITGTGTAQAQSSTASGSGTVADVIITGYGAAQAQSATASGAGAVLIQGAGAGQAQSATASGRGHGPHNAAIFYNLQKQRWGNMDYLLTNTAIYLTVGPFYDVSDGITPAIALTPANSRITVIADTDNGVAPVVVLDNVAGNDATNTLEHITGDDAGYYSLRLTAANLNRLGRLKVSVTDSVNHAPVFHQYTVISAAAYNTMTGVGGAQSVTLTIALADLTPISDVHISVLNSDQSATIATGISSALGVATFALDNGSYVVRLQKYMTNFTVPETLTVSGTTIDTYTGTPLTPDVGYGLQALIVVPTDPELVYNDTATIYADVLNVNSFSGDASIARIQVAAENMGTYYQLNLAQGVEYRVSGYIVGSGVPFLNKTLTITTDTTRNIALYA